MEPNGPNNHRAILPLFSPLVETPKVKYKTIVADPPWRYGQAGGYSWRKGRPSGETRDMLSYPTMTTEEIAMLPVGNWADDRAHLYLWTTQRYLEDAFNVVRAWGFERRKVLVWAKAPTGFSMGGAFGNATEFIVTGMRGKLSYKDRISRDWFDWKRGAHSVKPNAFYDIVESMSYGPYLDVFSRAQRLGWDTFGNESFNFGTDLPPERFTGVAQ